MKWIKSLWGISTSKSVGFVLAAVSIAIAIYGVWFYRPQPIIGLDVSDTKVLDIHESIGKLDVTYGGQSLKATNRELRVVQVRIFNSGRADITKDAFDSDDPFGFQISRGELLEPPIITGSSEYLSRHVTLREPDASTLYIAPIILDAGEWIRLNLLVAVKAGDTATIQPIGKIAGIRSVNVNTASEQAAKTLWSRIVHSDEWGIRILLSPIWIILFIMLSILIVLLGIAVTTALSSPIRKLRDWPVRRHRRGISQAYSRSRQCEPADFFVLDEYMKSGRGVGVKLRRYIERVARVNREAQETTAIKSYLAERFDAATIERTISFRASGSHFVVPASSSDPVADFTNLQVRVINTEEPGIAVISRALRRRGLETEVDGVVKVSAGLEAAVIHFEQFLSGYGEGSLDEALTKSERQLD